MIKSLTIALVFNLLLMSSYAQTLYFPPLTGSTWETTSPAELGWCEDSIPPLFDYLDASNSKGFLVLKDGKIVIEHYFDTFTSDSLWYWASAGKSLTSFLVGLAQEQGDLNINNQSSDYMGQGWTSLTPEQEALITVRHQLTMTTGLSDEVADVDCTDPECLVYLDDPGQRWAYHNAPYTLLDSVLQSATGQSINQYLIANVSGVTGIYGAYLPLGYNNVFFSKPRMMARFGLLMLNNGNWNGTQVMNDMQYFNEMIHSSQDINPAYGYLWWLNGSDQYMLPQSQFVFDGPAMPDAPMDMYAALGKNGQIINVVPSENIVIVRIGDAPTNEIFFVPNFYNNTIWEYLNSIMNCNVDVSEIPVDGHIDIYPNPTENEIRIMSTEVILKVEIFNFSGQLQLSESRSTLNVSALSSGVYFVKVFTKRGILNEKFVKS